MDDMQKGVLVGSLGACVCTTILNFYWPTESREQKVLRENNRALTEYAAHNPEKFNDYINVKADQFKQMTGQDIFSVTNDAMKQALIELKQLKELQSKIAPDPDHTM